jgi:Ulp1 family protease
VKRSQAEAAQLGHLNVARWTKDLDLFAKRFTVVPVVEHLHWSVAVIANLDTLDGAWKQWRQRQIKLRKDAKEQPSSQQQGQQRRGEGGGGGPSNVVDMGYSSDDDNDVDSNVDSAAGKVTNLVAEVGGDDDDDDDDDDDNEIEAFAVRGAPPPAGAPPAPEPEDAYAEDDDSEPASEPVSEVGTGALGVDVDVDDEEEDDDVSRVPCLVFMDSLNMHAALQVAANLRSYLLHEFRAKRLKAQAQAQGGSKGQGGGGGGSPAKRQRGGAAGDAAAAAAAAAAGGGSNGADADDDDDDDDEAGLSLDAFVEVLFGPEASGDRLPLLRPQVPLQDNCCDCGVFALQYVQGVVTQWPAITRRDVEAGRVPGFSKDMFTRGQVKAKREQLKALISHLRHVDSGV